MRVTGISGLSASSNSLLHALRLAAVALGIGLVMSASVARAEDDEQPEETFEQGIIKNIMRGIGGQSIEDSTINYRERSPLVVPSKIELPPPEAGKPKFGANWPKDPDEIARKEAIAASRQALPDEREAARPLMPNELNAPMASRKKSRKSDDGGPGAPVGYTNNLLSPAELGYSGNIFSSTLFGGNKAESAPFKGEPDRDSLTQPPTGYQTPSSNFAYGSGPLKPLNNNDYDPAAGKYGD